MILLNLLIILIILNRLIKMVLIREIFVWFLLIRDWTLFIEQKFRSGIYKFLRINFRLRIIFRNHIALDISWIILDSVIMGKICRILDIQRDIALYLIHTLLVVWVCRAIGWSIESFRSIPILEIHPFI